MQIKIIPVGSFAVNCYILHGPAGAIVIDPGAEADTIRLALEELDLQPAAYVLTHGHVDHISALADLVDHHPAPVRLARADLNWAFEPANRMPPFYDVPRRPAGAIAPLEDGAVCRDAGLEYTVVATPGHTPGSVCLWFRDPQVLFTGDTLFMGSVGRTDLPGGDSRVLNASLKKLEALPAETTLYPGHGPDTQLAHERRTNFFLR